MMFICLVLIRHQTSHQTSSCSNRPTGHLSGTLCRPDLLALEISQAALVKSQATASRAAGADANANVAETPGGHTSNPHDAASHDAAGSPDADDADADDSDADDAGSDINSDAVSDSESEYVPPVPSAAATPRLPGST